MRVFIAGPYTLGDVAENVHKAMEAGHAVLDAGHSPFVPHLSHFLHLQRQRPYEDWTRMDSIFVECCEAMIRLPGASKGADAEVALAERIGVPVFDSIEEWIFQMLR